MTTGIFVSKPGPGKWEERIYGVARCDNPGCQHITGTFQGRRRVSHWFDIRSSGLWARVRRNLDVAEESERERVFCQDAACQELRKAGRPG